MVTVKDLMNRDVYFIRDRDKVVDLLTLFDQKKITGAPVVDDYNRLVGIITVGDILSRIHKPLPLFDVMYYVAVLDTDAIVKGEIYDVLEKPVSELMTRKVITVNEDAGFADVVRLLSRHKFKKVPVVDGNRLIGVINRGEIVRYFVRKYLDKNRKATSDQS